MKPLRASKVNVLDGYLAALENPPILPLAAMSQLVIFVFPPAYSIPHFLTIKKAPHQHLLLEKKSPDFSELNFRFYLLVC
jgi:hypothetical protein